ncbi:MAG: CHAT domain-containing protein, partial [Cyanobacteria bacterium RI_101]|nr:CHAT domain-containing protein [Cyanobacteria bacterium RI_101]
MWKRRRSINLGTRKSLTSTRTRPSPATTKRWIRGGWAHSALSPNPPESDRLDGLDSQRLGFCVPAPDYTPLIETALALPGFAEESEYRQALTGFAHNAAMTVADQVIEAVKQGQIRHFFLAGGCDGAKLGRTYYTNLAQIGPGDLQGARVLALGASEFLDLPPLPGVSLELAAIRQTPWPGATLENQAFTPAALRETRRQGRYEIVHLATHAR